jgi:pyridoxal phosphate enzyme (YggS family)
MWRMKKSVPDNLEHIHNSMKKAAQIAQRDADDITLVAVSKRQPMERISMALEAGQRVFGENRVQEAQEHWTDLRTQYPDVQLHLIGPLQTNKVKEAVTLFDVIETVDREKLVDALAAEMKKQNKIVPCFIQVNTGEEEQKAGVAPQKLENLLAYAKEKKLPIKGLMCIPPVQEPAGLHFAFLKTLADRYGLKDLSMGMSADYDKAILASATYIRVGSALFGERN